MAHRVRDSELALFMEKQQKGKYIRTYIHTYVQKRIPEHQKSSNGDETNYPEKVENHFGN